MRFLSRAAAGIAALIVTSIASAGPYALASTATASGPSPFTACTADNAAAQEAAGSVLYPNSEPEPRADVNPTNTSNIVGAYQQDRWDDGGARGLVSSWTKNGGATWHPVVIPGITRCSNGAYDRASDPWVSFAPNGDLYSLSLSFDAFDTQNAILVSKSTNGDLYSLSLSFDAFDTQNAILVSKSTNGGESWGAPIPVAADDTNGLDKQSITADPFDSN